MVSTNDMICNNKHKGTIVCSLCGYGLVKPGKQNTAVSNLVGQLNFTFAMPFFGNTLHSNSLIRKPSETGTDGRLFEVSCGQCRTYVGEEQIFGNGLSSSSFKFKPGSTKFVPNSKP